MKTRELHASRLTVIAAGMAGVLACGFTPAEAQTQPAPPQGWFKACTKQEDVDICNVQDIVVGQSGNLILGVSLLELNGKTNKRVFQVTVPTYRMVPPGIAMQVDGGQAQKIDYLICLPDRCIAEAPLNDQLVGVFKRGQKVTFTSINFQNQPSAEDVTLQGFTTAYDGPPLKQAELDDRQKQLEDFVNAHADEFNAKLKAEQDKAMQQSQQTDQPQPSK